VLAEEAMNEIDEWLERDSVMTEAEREHCERAMGAFRKTLGKSSPPIADETLDELMGDYCG